MTQYTIITHHNSNRRRGERNEKNPTTISFQRTRIKGTKPVEIKRAERKARKAAATELAMAS